MVFRTPLDVPLGLFKDCLSAVNFGRSLTGLFWNEKYPKGFLARDSNVLACGACFKWEA